MRRPSRRDRTSRRPNPRPGSAYRGKPADAPNGTCTLLSQALEERRQQFFRQLARMRRRPTEPAIHDFRVALRRLIAALDLAGAVNSGCRITGVRRILRKGLKQFNALRDVHIGLLAMKGLSRTAPAVRSYVGSLRSRERVLLGRCMTYLRSMDVQEIERECAVVQQGLLVMSTEPAFDAAASPIAMGFLAEAFAKALHLKRAVTAADPASVHRLRVAFKKVRYAAEILAPLLPWMTRTRRKWMQSYQTLMGDVQDVEVMIAGVGRFAARQSMRNRVSVLPLQQELARQKRERVEAFMRRAGELEGFW